MAMPGRNMIGDYRYGYQGQEVDPETGKPAFELRLYDPRINRWLTTDPAGQYASPYLSMGNNWVNKVDPDGGEDDWVYNKETGEYIWDENVTSATDSDLNTDLFEYVGIGKNDIDRHFDNNNNWLVSSFTSPDINTTSFKNYLDKSLNGTLQTFLKTGEPQRFDNVRGLYENYEQFFGGTSDGSYQFTPNLTINGEKVGKGEVLVQLFRGTRKWNIISNAVIRHKEYNGKVINDSGLKYPYQYFIFSHHMKSESRVPTFILQIPYSASNFANALDPLVQGRYFGR